MSLNPRIKTIELGVEEMSSYTIYPLSMANEFKLTDILTKAAITVATAIDTAAEDAIAEDSTANVAVVKASIDVIKQNLSTILEMVTKKDNRPNLDNIDNYQFSELAELIFEMNFGGAIKNFQRLIEKVKNLFPSTGQSQSSSADQVTE